MIIIDGSKGEGGGQVLRTALSLAACTGQPFRIKNIRAGRKKPGLMRQHLTCVRAAEAVCGGKASGASLGSTELSFSPGEPKGGDYEFDVGTAGATTLVFQTVLPILLMADEASVVTFRGGTHTMAAPTLDFIEQAFLPPMRSIAAEIETERHQLGFYPAGGGAWTARMRPLQEPKPLYLEDRGELLGVEAEALRSNLPADICKREAETLTRALAISSDAVRQAAYDGPGPGNSVSVLIRCEHHAELFSAIGRYGVKAETVASNAAGEAKRYLSAEGAVSEYLADQLLLPLTLFQGGQYTTNTLSGHFVTNAEIIHQFLDVSVDTHTLKTKHQVRVQRR